MQARRLILIATMTLGLLMNHSSAAQGRPSVTKVPDAGTSQQIPEGRPIPQQWPHIGMSMRALERAYIESYEQSGFRLANRHRRSYPNGIWNIELVFQLKTAPKGSDAPGTTLSILISRPDTCGCSVTRESFVGPDAYSPDPTLVARGTRALIKADTAALAKVRQRLGMSLPTIDTLTP
ncbi:hypothetical protein [Xanthomonas campestris]|uniref:Secreted protein n=1 Tax=Xanthomonas campestris pv. papavericola TaxID=487881 RepID=A0AAJ3CGS2_XANCA|nr:hypothetical protein [Xanthomonas campestris]MEA0734726.1 hypothetical protein [Xanthomonas campestris pv. campestris]MEC3890450.1 hypothetical protein [Xanthomonas campestris pv. papavericola]